VASPKPFIGTADFKPRRTVGGNTSSSKKSRSPDKIESERKKMKVNFTVKNLKIKGLIKSKIIHKTEVIKEEFHQT